MVLFENDKRRDELGRLGHPEIRPEEPEPGREVLDPLRPGRKHARRLVERLDPADPRAEPLGELRGRDLDDDPCLNPAGFRGNSPRDERLDLGV